MKKIGVLLVLFFMAFAVYASEKTEERKVDAFTKVALSISANVELTQGELYALKLVGDEESLEKIITEVKSDKLIIRTENTEKWWNWFSSKNNKIGEVKIYVTLPEVKDLSVAGSGNIIADDAIKSQEMQLSIAGSGNIKIAKLISEEIEANIAGSGDISIKEGEIKEMEVGIAGSGDFSAGALVTEKAEVEIAGSGTCYVGEVKQSLYAKVAGSGDIYYTGNPENVDSKVAGSGKIRKK